MCLTAPDRESLGRSVGERIGYATVHVEGCSGRRSSRPRCRCWTTVFFELASAPGRRKKPGGFVSVPLSRGASVRAIDRAHRGGKHDPIHQVVGRRRGGGCVGPCRGACKRLVGIRLRWSVGRRSLVRAGVWWLSLLRRISVLRRLSGLGRLSRLGRASRLRLSGLGSAMAWTSPCPCSCSEASRLRLIVEARSADRARADMSCPHGPFSLPGARLQGRSKGARSGAARFGCASGRAMQGPGDKREGLL